MTRWLHEMQECREIENSFDGVVSETRFFRVSRFTWDWLHEHGGYLAAISLDDTPGILSVAAYVEEGRWNGWDWLCDELELAGLDSLNYGFA